MLTTLFLTVIILGICVVLLSIRLLLQKNGAFPNLHIGGNQALRDKGLACARTQDRERLKHKNLAERLKEVKYNIEI